MLTEVGNKKPNNKNINNYSNNNSNYFNNNQANNNQAPMVMFVLNSFEVDINPATPEVSNIFIKATEEPKDNKRLEVSQANSKEVLVLMNSLASQFGWGFLVNLIPVQG